MQSTEASNEIEGIVTTDTRIRQLVEEKTTPRNRNEQAPDNAAAVQERILLLLGNRPCPVIATGNHDAAGLHILLGLILVNMIRV